jgi:hypothetical protein
MQRLLNQWKSKVTSEYDLAKGVLRDQIKLGCTAGEAVMLIGRQHALYNLHLSRRKVEACWPHLPASHQRRSNKFACLSTAEAKAGAQGAAARSSFDWTPELLSTLLAFVHLRGLVCISCRLSCSTATTHMPLV